MFFYRFFSISPLPWLQLAMPLSIFSSAFSLFFQNLYLVYRVLFFIKFSVTNFCVCVSSLSSRPFLCRDSVWLYWFFKLCNFPLHFSSPCYFGNLRPFWRKKTLPLNSKRLNIQRFFERAALCVCVLDMYFLLYSFWVVVFFFLIWLSILFVFCRFEVSGFSHFAVPFFLVNGLTLVIKIP